MSIYAEVLNVALLSVCLKHPTLHIETARAERKKKGRIASEGGGPGDEIDLRQLK